MKREGTLKLTKSAKKLSVLYIEGDDTLGKSTSSLLKTIFLKVDSSLNGEDAYKKYQDFSYDIIIVDLVMSKHSGLEFISKVRKENPDVSIVIISAFCEVDRFLDSISYGIDGYLLKPVSVAQLNVILQKIVKRIESDKLLIEYQSDLEQKVNEKTAEIEHRCFHEYYTDLPNSAMLFKDLNTHKFSHMLLLDMSHFSVINKEYGKIFANHVIVKTARALENHIHRKAKLYKVESDRFVIVLKDTTVETVDEYCQQLVSFFDNKNVKVDDAELHVTFNIGVSEVTDDASETLINSEYALERSKTLGSRHYEIFNENISYFDGEKSAIKKLQNTRTLVLEEKIETYFQPIKNISQNRIYKYEVLARGNLDGEIIPPCDFIAPAEKLGLITSITRRMINQSFKFFQNTEYSFSINLTDKDLLEGYLIDYLKEKMKLYNMAPSRVIFEILENVTISEDNDTIIKELNKLKEMGFQLAIDDFGIENSNFSRLVDIDLDIIKIDGMYIKDLENNPKHRIIVKAIVNLAKTMGIKTVAEYVESEAIYEKLKVCGLDYAQGYYIGKPQSSLIT